MQKAGSCDEMDRRQIQFLFIPANRCTRISDCEDGIDAVIFIFLFPDETAKVGLQVSGRINRSLSNPQRRTE
jgi:hypothetical protein